MKTLTLIVLTLGLALSAQAKSPSKPKAPHKGHKVTHVFKAIGHGFKKAFK